MIVSHKYAPLKLAALNAILTTHARQVLQPTTGNWNDTKSAKKQNKPSTWSATPPPPWPSPKISLPSPKLIFCWERALKQKVRHASEASAPPLSEGYVRKYHFCPTLRNCWTGVPPFTNQHYFPSHWPTAFPPTVKNAYDNETWVNTNRSIFTHMLR